MKRDMAEGCRVRKPEEASKRGGVPPPRLHSAAAAQPSAETANKDGTVRLRTPKLKQKRRTSIGKLHLRRIEGSWS